MCFELKSEGLSITSNRALLIVTNLVVCDGLGHNLNTPVQLPGTVLIPQKSRQPTLFGERFQFSENIHQPPASMLRKWYDYGCWVHEPAE